MSKTILLGHGSGGQMSYDLINEVFVKQYGNEILDSLYDSSIVDIKDISIAFTTDSYVVDPPFFPGGNIGKLAVCGTVNDLAVSGATPLFLSASFILEEGFPLADLSLISKTMHEEATKAGVKIITGDTKVVKKGQCDKIFINTSGIGYLPEEKKHMGTGHLIQPGDKVIVNGYIGDHGIAILGARENMQFEIPIESDAAPLNALIANISKHAEAIHFMRDITRGGLATIAVDIIEDKNFGIELDEHKIPIREAVNGMCEIFGYDPLFLANEGKITIVVSNDYAQEILSVMQTSELGKNAEIIGEITRDHPGKAVLNAVTGGKRILSRLAGEQLPRIC